MKHSQNLYQIPYLYHNISFTQSHVQRYNNHCCTLCYYIRLIMWQLLVLNLNKWIWIYPIGPTAYHLLCAFSIFLEKLLVEIGIPELISLGLWLKINYYTYMCFILIIPFFFKKRKGKICLVHIYVCLILIIASLLW